MIIISLILAIIIGNLCSNPSNIIDSVSNITFFYITGLILLIVTRIYFFKKTRIDIRTVAKSAKHFKFFSIGVAFACTLLGFFDLYNILDTDPSTLVLIGTSGVMISGFSLLALTVLVSKGKFRNQLASSIGTIPILWMVYEVMMIFKNNLSNPHVSEYVFALLTYVFTSIAIYYFTSSFCVADKTNYFKEFYVLSVFVCISYASASFFGHTSSADISPMLSISTCGLLNIFMLPYYITSKPLSDKLAESKKAV